MNNLNFGKDIKTLKEQFAKLEALAPELRQEAAKIPGGNKAWQSAVDQIGPAKQLFLELLERTPGDLAATNASVLEQVAEVHNIVAAIRSQAKVESPIEPAPPAEEPDLTLAAHIGSVLLERYGLPEEAPPEGPTDSEWSSVASWSFESEESEVTPAPYEFESALPPDRRRFDTLDDWIGCSSSVASMATVSSAAGDAESGALSSVASLFGWRSSPDPTAGSQEVASAGSSVMIAGSTPSFDPDDVKRRFLQWQTRRQEGSGPSSDS